MAKELRIMLQLKNISKQYKTGDLVQKALDNVSLNFRDNEFVSILGPSGSGKSTLLNIVGGLDRYDKGDLIISGVSTKKYKDRDWDSYRNHTIGFVFQSYNLIGHQTVLSNVELALTISGISKTERRKRAIDALTKVGLGNHIHKKPNQLSGGQMQRVAIARALVNNPEILLADEPTGALDSETSIQVMNLLKEVAKDRLVIMVTHNPDLAKEYSTRIVELRDGKIVSDNDPLEIKKKEKAIHKTFGKSSMKRSTAVVLSFNNLKTKLKRTLMVAFAGSIGIIGISLILAISNGVNQYIQNTEEATVSDYPLTIASSSLSLTSAAQIGRNVSNEGNGDVKEIKALEDMVSVVSKNDLASLKNYFENENRDIYKYSKSVEYTYGITPQIYMVKNDDVRIVNPNEAFSPMGITSSTGMLSMMSQSPMGGLDVFNKLPENKEIYMSQFDVKHGHWPENSNECVIVTTPNGGITDFLFYTLGLRDSVQLDEMVKNFSEGKQSDIKIEPREWKYEDFDNITFKVLNAYDKYSYDASKNVYVDRSNDTDFINEAVKNKGFDLKVVGIVSPKEDKELTALSTGIWYDDGLIDTLMNNAKESDIVKAQLADREKNILTGENFGVQKKIDFNLSNLFTIDQKTMVSAFSINPSKIKIDTSSLTDFSDLSKYKDIIAKYDVDTNFLKNLDIKIPDNKLKEIINELIDGYTKYASLKPSAEYTRMVNAIQNILNAGDKVTEAESRKLAKEITDAYNAYATSSNKPDRQKITQSFVEYLKTNEAKKIIENGIESSINSNEIQNKIQNQINNYKAQTQNLINELVEALKSDLTDRMMQTFQKSSGSLMSAISIDTAKFASAFKMNMTQEEIQSLIASMIENSKTSFESNLISFGYAEEDNLGSIVIYPKDFDSKGEITNILDRYNKSMEESNQHEKAISYTDLVGTMMSSVTTIVNIISYVLIAFVAISLIVSSIMIGVITYISVLERRKEIGILRAIGASKKNISQVFNAETIIIGFIAGLIGIIISILITIPVNSILHEVTHVMELNAFLSLGQCITLILISVVLTLIGGFIPAKSAAKSDPVKALREE